MLTLLLLPPLVSILLLIVHFFRGGTVPAMLLCVFLLLLLLVRRPWAVRILQVSLLLGSVEWVRVALLLTTARIEAGAPYLRLACILGSVALLTFGSVFVFHLGTVRRHFKVSPGSKAN